MPRLPSAAIILGSSALLFASGFIGCSGDSEDDDDSGIPSPSPAPSEPPASLCADDSFAASGAHPTKWLLTRQFYQSVYVYSNPFASCPDLQEEENWYPQYSTSYFLVTWEDQGDGTFIQKEQLCGIRVSPIDIGFPLNIKQDSIVPQQLIDNVAIDAWQGSFSRQTVQDEDGNSFQCAAVDVTSSLASQRLYTVWGANLSDPENQKCPMHSDCSEYPDASAEVDMDKDSKPGVTVQMWADGELVANTAICQRLLFRQEPGVVYKTDDGSYQISGSITNLLNDQSQYAVDGEYENLLEGKDPEVNWTASTHGANSFYVMKPVDDATTCAQVVADLPPDLD